jgi:hypothetical protein
MNLLSRNTVQQIDWKQWHPMSNGGQPSHLVRHRKIHLRSKSFLRWIPEWRDGNGISELTLDEICELLRQVIRKNRDIPQPNE